MGRPSHQPDAKSRQQVEMLVSYGLKQDAIAAILGIHDDTLRKHYAHELAFGRDKVVAQVANALVKKALSDRADSVNAAKFYLQSQAGWKERSEQELAGSVSVQVKEIVLRGVRSDDAGH